MPRAKGMVLTERDRALLGYLGVARYVTAAQVHRLIAPGHDKAIVSRRLARLCERGPNPGDDPYVRRIEYRRTDALPFPVWTLTPRVRAVAADSAPGPVAAVEPGAGVQFVERVLALNEVLLGLVLVLRTSEAAPLSALPFRWRVGAEPLRFVTYDRALGRSRPALLRPDAILDVPSRRRRFFLEAETGSRGLAPAGPRDGHVTRRLSRYGTFFMGFADRAGDVERDRDRTWYRAAFPDGFDAEVAVLVQSEARRAHVERVIRDYVGRSGHLHARALSLAAAASELKPLVVAPAPSPIQLTNVAAPAAPKVRTVAIDAGLAKRLDDGLNLFATTYSAITRAARGHAAVCPTRFMPDPGPAHDLNAFRELLLYEILGYPRGGRFFDRVKEPTATVRELWAEYEPITKRDNDSWRSDVGRAAHLVRLLGDRRASRLTRGDVEEYRTKRQAETTQRGGAPSPGDAGPRGGAAEAAPQLRRRLRQARREPARAREAPPGAERAPGGPGRGGVPALPPRPPRPGSGRSCSSRSTPGCGRARS